MVSLNSIMVDGTGMCGGCRVLLGNESKFACVDGPEFDASAVNFDVLMQRNTMYRDKECQSLKAFEEHKAEELAEVRAELKAKKQQEEHARGNRTSKESSHADANTLFLLLLLCFELGAHLGQFLALCSSKAFSDWHSLSPVHGVALHQNVEVDRRGESNSGPSTQANLLSLPAARRQPPHMPVPVDH